MEKQEAKKKLEEISANISSITKKYNGNTGYGKVEKQQMLADFQALFAESQDLKNLFEEVYDDMPETFNQMNTSVYDYGKGLLMIATIVNLQTKADKE
jgi:hypothetical protein